MGNDQMRLRLWLATAPLASGNGGAATGANAAVAAGDNMPGGGVSATVKVDR